MNRTKKKKKKRTELPQSEMYLLKPDLLIYGKPYFLLDLKMITDNRCSVKIL